MGEKIIKQSGEEHAECDSILDELMQSLTFFKHILPLLTEYELINMFLQDQLTEMWSQTSTIKDTIQENKPEIYDIYMDTYTDDIY